MSGDNLKPGYTPIRELMELGRAGGDVGETKAEAMLANPALKDALANAKEAAAAAAVEPELRPAPPSEVKVDASIVRPAAAAPAQVQRAVAVTKPAAGLPVYMSAEAVAPAPDPTPAPRVLLTPRGRGFDEPTDVLRATGSSSADEEPPRTPAKPSIVGYAIAGAVGLLIGVGATLGLAPGASPPAPSSASAAAAPVCPPTPPAKACEPCAACPAAEPPPPCPAAGTPTPTGPGVRPPKPPRTAEPGSTGPDILP